MSLSRYNYLCGALSIFDWQSGIDYTAIREHTSRVANLRAAADGISRSTALMRYFQERRAGQVAGSVLILSSFALAAVLPTPMWTRCVVASIPLISFVLAGIAVHRMRETIYEEPGNRDVK